MFDVQNKTTKENTKVFSVEKIGSASWFLVYENGEWKWVLSDNYIPVFVDINEFIKKCATSTVEATIEAEKVITAKTNKEGEEDA